jgi:hypothetical protein
LLWGFGALALRLAVQWTIAKVKHQRFDALDRPPPLAASAYSVTASETEVEQEAPVSMGKFF